MSVESIARNAREASRVLARISSGKRTEALHALAASLRESVAPIVEANRLDLEAGKAKGLSSAFLDRLALDQERIEGMAQAVEEIAAQQDPIGAIESQWIRPNGLRVGRMRIPLGVICVIYESRPNVTSDAAALAIRSGNAIILKGGSDARNSNREIGKAVSRAMENAGLPGDAVAVLADEPREAIGELLQLDELIDLVIPRGGEGLIRYVAETSRIPVVKHYKGVCHLYVDAAADLDVAVKLAVNGKVSRPSVCNAVETILVHEAIAQEAVPRLVEALATQGVRIHGDERVASLASGVEPATEEDWHAEYLDLEVAMRVVASIDAAIAHIAAYGSDHTEAIVTRDLAAANQFTTEVLSSCVMVNASTRFADGGQLGLGAEIGISTSRVHAYGPMGAEGLTTTRFVVLGEGHARG